MLNKQQWLSLKASILQNMDSWANIEIQKLFVAGIEPPLHCVGVHCAVRVCMSVVAKSVKLSQPYFQEATAKNKKLPCSI